MSQWKPVSKDGESLHFENCKGGYFSSDERYALRVIGKTYQKQLTGKNFIPAITSENLCHAPKDYINQRDDILTFLQSNPNVWYDGININGLDWDFCTPKEEWEAYLVDGDGALLQGKNSVAINIGKPSWLVSGTYTYSEESNDTSLYNGKNHFSLSFYKDLVCLAYYKLTNYQLTSSVQGTYSHTANVVVPLDYDFAVIRLDSYAETTESYRVKRKNIQLERGDTATEYEEYCGGKPSPSVEFPQPIECVKQGTEIACGDCTVICPCDLYEDDVWYPMTGKVVCDNHVIDSYNGEGITLSYVSTTGALTNGAKVVHKYATRMVSQYTPQVIYAKKGDFDVTQRALGLSAKLMATMLELRRH